jgi:signal transduction histidine kinase
MLARFLAGSIRRQIAVLAVGPVVVLAILGTISEHLTLKDPESVSQARTVAMRIEMVLDMVRAAEAGEETVILGAVARTGLQVKRVSAAEWYDEKQYAPADELRFPEDDFRLRVEENLPSTLDVKRRSSGAAGETKRLLITKIDQDRALAFALPPALPDSWITDHQVNRVLMTMAIFVPVILLSLYGSRMIAAPLLRFSRTARRLDPDNGPERPFAEMGSLEVRTLAKSLNDMRSRVQAMIEARTRMLRAISHDLRTPLTRLRLRAERSTQPPLRSALLADIDALTFMIEETLVYLRKDMSTENPLKADLPSLIATACSDFADIGYSVTYQGPERFAYPCKPHALLRAVANLIDNGTKFACHVTVELRVAGDGAVAIRVADDGPGIPPALQASALEPFSKLDTARSERGGFGLGLSIVQDIVHAHLGMMTLANAEPHGLIVEISLPAQSESPTSPAEGAGPNIS